MVESIRELRETCRSPNAERERSISMVLGRKVSIYFTKLLLYTNITANQTTVLDVLIGIIAGMFLVYGNRLFTLIGALLLQLYFIFDLVDGEVARYRKSSSLTGVYLERLGHYIVPPFIFMCIAFGLYNTFEDIWIFALGFSASLSLMLLKLVQECKLLVVLYPRLNPHYQESVAKISEIKAKKSEHEEQIYLASSSPTIMYNTIRLSYKFFTNWHNVIFVASLVDMIVPVMMIGSLSLNTMYVILFLYGIFSPFVWIGWMFLAVKTKSPDKLYHSLFDAEKDTGTTVC